MNNTLFAQSILILVQRLSYLILSYLLELRKKYKKNFIEYFIQSQILISSNLKNTLSFQNHNERDKDI